MFEAGKLVYIGHTGGGFDHRSLIEMRDRLEPLEQDKCPFPKEPATNARVHWVRPELVCEVEFQEWTQDGVMRQPIFLGLRDDKRAHSVRREWAAPTGELRQPDPTATGEPALTNLDKVYWPGESITKGELIDYYREVAPVLLPYLRDRPQSLHRHPDGIGGKDFFQKDVSQHPPPDWVETTVIDGSEGKASRYIVCQDEPTLLYLANLGLHRAEPVQCTSGDP